jgi:integrase
MKTHQKRQKSKGKAPVWEYETGVAGMVRHLASGNYYSRFQLHGKRTMKALKTDVFSVAKERHLRKMANVEAERMTGAVLEKGKGKVGDLIVEALNAHKGDTSLTKKSKACFQASVDRLLEQWPACFGADLRLAKYEQITNERVERFANFLHSEARWRRNKARAESCGYGAVTVNVTLEVLHRIMRFAKARHYITTVPFELKGELGQKDIRKPEPKKKIVFPAGEKITEVFKQLRTISRTPNAQPELIAYLQGRADESADFAEFMAYSGARQKEAATWVWEDEVENSICIRGTKTEGSRDRDVPKIAAMTDLLARMKARRNASGRKLTGKAFSISECRVALASACKRAGVPRWTHHTLRHLFATKCIEAGVDIQTVSRWLGHSDGGALAMKTYGHLRQEHSQAQAAKVSFEKGASHA